MNFRAFVDYVAEGNKSALADVAKIETPTIRYLFNESCQPHISTLLRVSCNLRVPVLSFLEPDLARAAASWHEAKARIQKTRPPSTRSRANIKPESHAINDLEIDSLDFLDVAFAIDKAFAIKLPLERWTQEVNDGKVSSDQYFVLQNLCARIDDLVAGKEA